MRNYKSQQEKAAPMNTCAPNKLIDDFLMAATDLELGETLSEAVQIAMKFVVENKDNEKFKEEIQKLK